MRCARGGLRGSAKLNGQRLLRLLASLLMSPHQALAAQLGDGARHANNSALHLLKAFHVSHQPTA